MHGGVKIGGSGKNGSLVVKMSGGGVKTGGGGVRIGGSGVRTGGGGENRWLVVKTGSGGDVATWQGVEVVVVTWRHGDMSVICTHSMVYL